MLRELLKARADKLARAQAIWDTADKDGREFTEAEQAEFEQLLGKGESTGEIGALDAKITDLEDKREKLRAAAEKKFSTESKAEKPKEGETGKALKRAEFDKLDPTVQAAYVKGGGKVED